MFLPALAPHNELTDSLLIFENRKRILSVSEFLCGKYEYRSNVDANSEEATFELLLLFQVDSSLFERIEYCCQHSLYQTAQHRPNEPRRPRKAIYSSLMTDEGSFWTGLSINILSRYSSMTSQSKRDFFVIISFVVWVYEKIKVEWFKSHSHSRWIIFSKAESVIQDGMLSSETKLWCKLNESRLFTIKDQKQISTYFPVQHEWTTVSSFRMSLITRKSFVDTSIKFVLQLLITTCGKISRKVTMTINSSKIIFSLSLELLSNVQVILITILTFE